MSECGKIQRKYGKDVLQESVVARVVINVVAVLIAAVFVEWLGGSRGFLRILDREFIVVRVGLCFILVDVGHQRETPEDDLQP